MRAAYRVVTILGVCYVLLNLYSYITPHWFWTIVSTVALIGLVCAFLVTAIRGVRRWKKTSHFWILPAVLALVFILSTWITPPVGRLLADVRFRNHLVEYEKTVEELRKDPNLPTTSLSIVSPTNVPDGVRAIKAARCTDSGSVIAAFLLDTDVPLLHEGYVFDSDKKLDSCMPEALKPERNWPYIRHVDGGWYHFSDQPGL